MKRMQQQHFILKKRRKDQSPFYQKLDMDLERANLLLKPNELMMICAGAAVVVLMVFVLLGYWLPLCILFAGVGLFLPLLYVKLLILIRMGKAQAQFADVLDTLVGCFKSGYGFSRAVQVVSENFEDPWSTELGKVATEMNFGGTQEDALLALYKRIPNPDVALFVTAVLIQKETGGNLAELLTNLSKTIRERYKLLSKVKALSAQGKLSAIIVFLIPFGLAGTFTLMMPHMMLNFIHNPIGVALVVFACVMQAIGGLVLKKIVSLEV
jgi:tight adherence protein B